MAAAISYSSTIDVPVERASLFKEDRPREIDRFISFFGSEDAEPSGDVLLEALRADEEDE